MKKLFLNAFLALCLLPMAAADLTGGYQCKTKDYIVYVRLTQMKDKLTGFMQVVSYSTEAPAPETTTHRLQGTVAGKAFTMTRDGVQFGRRNIEGKVVPAGLDMSMPTDGGYVAGMSLKPTTDAAWNKLVDSFTAECDTRYFRRIWFNSLANWLPTLNNNTDVAESQLRSNNERLEPLDKKVKGLQDEVKSLKDKLAAQEAAKTEAAANAEKAEKTFRDLQQVLYEKWSQVAQDQATAALNAYRKAQKEAEDAQTQAYQSSLALSTRTAELMTSEQELKTTQEAINSAKATIGYGAQWRKRLREAGFTKHLRVLESGKVLKARALSEASIYLSPEEGATVINTLPALSIVDVLPLDGGWTIVRAESGSIAWVKSAGLKML